jgi:hypothetical protein
VKRLVNAQSHFTSADVNDRIESRERLIALKTHAKNF